MSTLDNALANARGNTTQQLWTLHKALEVLQAKARGDAYWADLNVDHGWKKLRRSQLTRPKKKDPFLPTAPLKELIPKFDEEWELDLLLKRTQFNAAENKKWWAERNLSNCHTVEPEDPEYPIYHLQTWDRYYVPDMEPDVEPNMVSGMVPDMITYM
jgi:hypothetical protein